MTSPASLIRQYAPDHGKCAGCTGNGRCSKCSGQHISTPCKPCRGTRICPDVLKTLTDLGLVA